jgi:Phage integrase family
MLRHATGYALANEGTDTRLIQDFLGHASIANTVRYTKLAPARLAAVRVRLANAVPIAVTICGSFRTVSAIGIPTARGDLTIAPN